MKKIFKNSLAALFLMLSGSTFVASAASEGDIETISNAASKHDLDKLDLTQSRKRALKKSRQKDEDKSLTALQKTGLVLGVTVPLIGAAIWASRSNYLSNVNPPASVEESRILAFYSDQQSVQMESWKFTWSEAIQQLRAEYELPVESVFFEKCHHFIQWLFPLFTLGVNRDAETWIPGTVAAFKQDAILMDRIVASFCAVVGGYYKLEIDGVQGDSRDKDQVKIHLPVGDGAYDRTMQAFTVNGAHNRLRIDRILECMAILGLVNYTQAFLDCLTTICKDQKVDSTIKTSHANYWSKVFHRATLLRLTVD